ncbi:protein SMAX1-LIKE 3-like isoform X2 [Chenopodium quinoa]|uniref:protein SMAX1-LIKE 3-like isoform X2 n=1 Tax=Chenopodium quinoa TaxID=63459 RepID=UPI000B77FC96|nr:protein SMAX1-LIKE 3-like isoform X2 [Chenopodium quinoa]
MRTGGCSIQQSLTPEAATIVKQAINLARRRGHAQVTPIHIASVMLASPAGLLRAACLKSHSHPLQCKALELCFNVALNRLPTTTPTPILGTHSHYPSLANALMAAFKRAQAHQRRGSIESQQQPILALKIETEQLVISILDDPSVSRVMREAGFLSPHVKSNVEQVVTSIEGCSQTTTITSNTTTNIKTEIVSPMVYRSTSNHQTLSSIPPLNQFDLAFSKPLSQPRAEDVSSVIESWAKKREKSSIVLVGECLSSIESVVRGVKERVERGDQVPLELRYVQFLNCPLSSMKNLSREEIDLRLGEIRCLLKGCVGRGVVLYLGDLKWVAEYWSYYGEQRKHYYCPVEHLVMGLRRLVFGNMELTGRLWLMGIATFNSYMKCKSGIPSLETLLDLHPLTIPAGSLDLSLNLESSLKGQNKSDVSGEGVSWPLLENKIDMQLTCCMDCSANCHREVKSLAGTFRNNDSTTTTTTTTTTSTSSSLPSWLQKCKEESKEISAKHQETVQIKELCKKWNIICSSSSHQTSNVAEKTINFSSCSPSSSTSISSYDHNKNQLQDTKPITTWPMLFEPTWASKEHQFLMSNIERKPELLSNPNSTPNSASSSEATEAVFERPPSSLSVFGFKENNPENLEALCSALEKRVPWQNDIIPEITTTILRIRSGMMSRKCNTLPKEEQQKKETWLFFLGADEEGKFAVGRELAKLIFGTFSSFKAIGVSSYSSTRADSTDDIRSKRLRDDSSGGYLERLAAAVKENPHRVFFIEDVEQLDQRSLSGIKRAIEAGKISLSDEETVSLEDAIVIFSCDSFSSASRACSPTVKQKLDDDTDKHDSTDLDKFDHDEVEEATSSCVRLDLNVVFDEDNGIDEHSIGDIRILDSVDKQVFFKIQVL